MLSFVQFIITVVCCSFLWLLLFLEGRESVWRASGGLIAVVGAVGAADGVGSQPELQLVVVAPRPGPAPRATPRRSAVQMSKQPITLCQQLRQPSGNGKLHKKTGFWSASHFSKLFLVIPVIGNLCDSWHKCGNRKRRDFRRKQNTTEIIIEKIESDSWSFQSIFSGKRNSTRYRTSQAPAFFGHSTKESTRRSSTQSDDGSCALTA